jgi:glucose-1-phosphate thymidylyltransferase
MRLAGIRRAFLVIREGNWDIPAYYGDGIALLDMHLAYVVAFIPHGPPFSLDAAYPFVSESIVAMGFPDIVFRPEDAFKRLLIRQSRTQADLVLGLFRLAASSVDDRVEVDDEGRVVRCLVNQEFPHPAYSWIIAVWTPVFTRFMHEFLREYLESDKAPAQELILGYVVRAAVDSGLIVQSVAFPDGRFLDIGTPAGARLLPAFLDQPESV